MDNNSNDYDSLRAAASHSIATINVALEQLADARARLAAHLPPPRSMAPAENFTQARYEQADRTRAQIENEIAEVEDAFGGDHNHPLAKERLEPLEAMLEKVLRFMDECRAHLAMSADQPNRKARRVAKAKGLDATYQVREG